MIRISYARVAEEWGLLMRVLASTESVECLNDTEARKLEEILRAMESRTAIPKNVYRSGRTVRWGFDYIEEADG